MFFVSSALATCALVFAATGGASAFAEAPAGLASASAEAPARLAQESEPGERIMNSSCVNACHSVRVIQTQAMTPEAWGKTVENMIGMGAKVSNE